MSMVASRRRLPSVVSTAAILLLATAAWWQAAPAHADDVTVLIEMTDEGARYTPAEVTIQLGDTVTWVWKTNGHSVTHQPEEGQERAFDSHPDDPEDPLSGCPPLCGEEGEDFPFSDFPEPGTFVYGSRMDPAPEGSMRGVVKVEPAPAPSSPSPQPEASQSETPAEPSPDPASSSESQPEPASEPEPEPEPEPAPEPAPPPPAEPAPEPQRAAPQPVGRDAATEVPTAGSPRVAAGDSSPSPVPTPSFEDFPRASDPTDDTDVSGEVALGGTDDGGGTARTVWALVGGASVLGTLGAFGRTVLFADTWDA